APGPSAARAQKGLWNEWPSWHGGASMYVQRAIFAHPKSGKAGVQSGSTQLGENIIEMGSIAGFDHQLEQGRLGRQVGKSPLVGNLDDVGPRLGQQGGNRSQLPRPVDDVERQLRQPSLACEFAGQNRGN